MFHACIVDRLKEEVKNLRGEVAQFQVNVHSVGHQCSNLQGMMSDYDNHTHIPLEDHRRAVAKLDK